MPKPAQRGMTKNQKQRMDRIRAARGLPPQTYENMMYRMAAVVCMADATPHNRDEIGLRGFMAVLHPEVPQHVVDQLVRDTRGPK